MTRRDVGGPRRSDDIAVGFDEAREAVRPAIRESADHFLVVVCGPVLETGADTRGHVHALVVEFGGRGKDAHGADDRETGGDHRHDDRESGGDTSKIQGEARATGDHQVAEHALGEVDRSRGTTQRRRDDEPEHVHDTGTRPVKLRNHRRDRRTLAPPRARSVEPGEDGGYTDVDDDQCGHQSASLAQFHDSGRDHGTVRYPRTSTIARGVAANGPPGCVVNLREQWS